MNAYVNGFLPDIHIALALQNLQGLWQVVFLQAWRSTTCMILAPTEQHFYSALLSILKYSEVS